MKHPACVHAIWMLAQAPGHIEIWLALRIDPLLQSEISLGLPRAHFVPTAGFLDVGLAPNNAATTRLLVDRLLVYF